MNRGVLIGTFVGILIVLLLIAFVFIMPNNENNGSDSSSVGDTTNGGTEIGCVNGDLPLQVSGPETREKVSGENGEFTDECDENGNLIEYRCEIMVDDGCNPLINDFPIDICPSFQTGEVTSIMHDCAGTCSNGECAARCPDFEDVVEYLEITNGGEQVVFENLQDNRQYDCDLTVDQPNDNYDCKSDPTVGSTISIISLGLHSSWCTGMQAFNIGTGNPQQCTYSCEIII